MHRTSLRIALACALVLVVALGYGCAKREPVVAAKWPKADTERTVKQPPRLPVWPLTGLDATDEQATRARVVSVKIENSKSARPQTGLGEADVVYETLTEGGITRFNALFHSHATAVVGPVRSARLSDIELVPQYGALFAHAGANTIVMNRIREAGLADVDYNVVPPAYWRSTDRKAPHNLYTSIAKLREGAVKKRMPATQDVPGLLFDRTASAAATPTIVGLTVPFDGANKVGWSYDASSDRYLRSINEGAHKDKVTGEQLSARNVVVMWAKTGVTSKRDVAGSPTLEIELNGTNRASIFRNGRRFDGTWSAAKGQPARFVAEDGSVIRLAPGNTWIEVIPTSMNIMMR